MTDYSKKFSDYFESHMTEILRDLNGIISIESAADETSDVRPFGEGSAKALAWGEEFMKGIGMDTVNFDNYAVRGDFSEGEPKLGILAHLDTVPAGTGWTYPPYSLTERNGILYGRGVIDDKGPAVAVLWAAKAVRELGIPVENFRIIFGGNEENGCEDMKYYESKERFPKKVFTPDGSFPVLNCEKGMVHLTFSAPFEDDEIAQINGGTVINAIPEKCRIKLREPVGRQRTLVFAGKAAHGSRPENGVNAVTKFLAEHKTGNPLLKSLAKLFPAKEYDGSSCGMDFEDSVSGKMTCALTMLNTVDGRLCGGIDIRFPIDRSYGEISGMIVSALENEGFTVDSCNGMEPHYVPEDSDLVRSLLRVYERVKGEKGYCIAEGGITYVHNTEGAVAFGAEFPDENNNMHGADEHISMETFRYNLNMYANAIAEIAGIEP